LVKVLDSELSVSSLIIRLFVGLVLAIILAVFLYGGPSIVDSFVISSDSTNVLKTILPQVLNPQLAVLGLLTSIMILPVIMLRKTKAEGYTLIAFGGLLLFYLLMLFSMGNIGIRFTEASFYLPYEISPPFSLDVKINVNLLLLTLFYLITPALIIMKGSILIYENYKDQRDNVEG
jgi:hypothetical protein